MSEQNVEELLRDRFDENIKEARYWADKRNVKLADIYVALANEDDFFLEKLFGTNIERRKIVSVLRNHVSDMEEWMIK